ATLTRQAEGRRVNALDPRCSLLLLKPTEAGRVRGGSRCNPGSPEYRVLSTWIASGMAPPRPDDPRLLRLAVTPARQSLTVGAASRLSVIAHYSDGHAENVTRWARFATADESVAQIDQEGQLTVKGPGETALTVGFLTAVASVRVASPFPNRVADE